MMALKTPPGLIIAAPASGSGKTVITAILSQGLQERGHTIANLKVGPDYIDPHFYPGQHANIDLWAMRPTTYTAVLGSQDVNYILCEGVMGLFDGETDFKASSADVARVTGWPIILVVNAAASGESLAALIHGFNDFSPDINLAGIILNNLGSPRHTKRITQALKSKVVPVLGTIQRHNHLAWPSRHLGLQLPQDDITQWCQKALNIVAHNIDWAGLEKLLTTQSCPPPKHVCAHLSSAPLATARHIAIAQDAAFSFVYPHHRQSWASNNQKISFFSPLADAKPDSDATAIFLPGGYPELHGAQLSTCHGFFAGLKAAANRGVTIYGECGGFMVLGKAIIDIDRQRHAMAGLLPITTAMGQRYRHLGYRQMRLTTHNPLGRAETLWRGHAFHYAHIIDAQPATTPLFIDQTTQEPVGWQQGSVMGSFVHLIDQHGQAPIVNL